MTFVGQLYASDWFPLDGHLALQFYVCDDCYVTPKNKCVRMQPLPPDSTMNAKASGIRCKSQPMLYISYTPIEDSLDQWLFARQDITADDMPDKHLFSDKVGGLFPYDGYECPKITKQNRMVAQFSWKGIGGPLYLFRSAREGFYAFLYPS